MGKDLAFQVVRDCDLDDVGKRVLPEGEVQKDWDKL